VLSIAQSFASVEQGIVLAKQGKYHEAMKCYNQALEVDPHHRGMIYHHHFAAFN